MLHQTITPDICRTVLNERSLAMTLVAEVRRSLERDPVLARHYLERLEALLHPEAGAAGRKRDLLPASVLPASVFSDGIADRPSKRKGGLAPWQERRVVDYIDANLATPILAEHLAALVGLSAGHFTRAFKASTGETPHVFLVRQRVRRAQILMLETPYSLARIACACGLTDQAHLARLFRAAVGATPTAWRRAARRPVTQ
jgi:AraC-like DNA-binding protein